MNAWIIPCLVKSQSLISAEDWDSTPATTNTGVAQHHWTNSLTGINLSLVEAIERPPPQLVNFATWVSCFFPGRDVYTTCIEPLRSKIYALVLELRVILM
ncbi:hypothetical protein B0H10DRAFT_2103196 [Mycena sp. CBHHK59/15]|nr:hypothetical protein B0H10DRAFT_2103196 [Mycena sp. CBHHK59/15]